MHLLLIYKCFCANKYMLFYVEMNLSMSGQVKNTGPWCLGGRQVGMVCKSGGEALIQPQILHAVAAGCWRGGLCGKPQRDSSKSSSSTVKICPGGVECLTHKSGCCGARQIVRLDAKQRFSLDEIIWATCHLHENWQQLLFSMIYQQHEYKLDKYFEVHIDD